VGPASWPGGPRGAVAPRSRPGAAWHGWVRVPGVASAATPRAGASAVPGPASPAVGAQKRRETAALPACGPALTAAGPAA